jgi:uncharacterized coiled-coil protein SlyX
VRSPVSPAIPRGTRPAPLSHCVVVSDDGIVKEAGMAGTEERVGYLEGRVEAQERRIDDVRDAIASLERRMEARFASIDTRFEAIDRRFESLERWLTGLDDKMTRGFVWIAGAQVTTLAAVVAALVSR